MNNKLHISVVTPVYGCGVSLDELYERLKVVLSSISDEFEIIMVNDASLDNAWEIIKLLSQKDPRVKGINLSRNFGQHRAITAGLDFAKGEWVVIMDCDLQDQPEEIPILYQKAQEGFDVVVGLRRSRQDSFFKKICSRLFYKVFSYFTSLKVNNRIGNFGIYARKVIRSISALKEQNQSFGLFSLWVGYRRIEVEIEHARRPQGKSSYTFRLMVWLALDSIASHSNRLLHLSIKLGFMFSLSAILYTIWLIVRYYTWDTPVAGWTSVMVSVYFTTGLIIAAIGVVGLYVGKIFDEVKKRPLYIIDSTTFEIKD